jgi:hypothetical protein
MISRTFAILYCLISFRKDKNLLIKLIVIIVALVVFSKRVEKD